MFILLFAVIALMAAFYTGLFLGGCFMSTFVTKAKVAALLADLDAKDKKITDLEQALTDARDSVDTAVEQAISALKDQIKIRDDHINVLEAKLAEEGEELSEINSAIDARRNPPAPAAPADAQQIDAWHPVDAAPVAAVPSAPASN